MITWRFSRVKREEKTVEVMIRSYCRDMHGNGGELCSNCQELLLYSRTRLDNCPFGQGKTTCAKCTIHCYKPAQRAQVREVMRYAGPRMLYRHPTLALLHVLDRLRDKPVNKQGRA